ncbi:peptidyl-prolyl cis-trans isomerase G-like [Battus philenor]|uniref:peptidyl-prolyl cis-trans isomerase G-like n=1 Tax=Battus philenor TaxID=42288 RepID=UPI0035CFF5C3
MGDSLKLSKDKRHRSSSSIAGVALDGTLSERKIDIKASIPEVDDQFAIAEARCDDLQEKIDLVKVLKRKRKLKKRSTTRVTDQQIAENVPFISVRTQPKTKVTQQAARMRRFETPLHPTRGYLDPATLEQHRMITKNNDINSDPKMNRPISRVRIGRERGEGTCGQGVQISTHEPSMDAMCGDDEIEDYTDNRIRDQKNISRIKKIKPPLEIMPRLYRKKSKQKTIRKSSKEEDKWQDDATPGRPHKKTMDMLHQQYDAVNKNEQNPEQPSAVLELYNKNYSESSPESWHGNTPVAQPAESRGQQNNAQLDFETNDNNRRTSPNKIQNVREEQMYDEVTGPLPENTVKDSTQEVSRTPRRIKYKTRRHYELPTMASRLKQTDARFYAAITNGTVLPFVSSKSTGPSYNLVVNLQQVLNRLKIQQPLSGIPSTMAHHMGLGYIPTHGTKSAAPMLEGREINSIKLGRRLVHLPTYKNMSYNRLLRLFSEGNGMVPKFLSAISKPHYFYTSMYNSLVSNREDIDGATSKGRGGCTQLAKQSLAEYASLYRDYENLEKSLKVRHDPNLVRRRDEVRRELMIREDHIRKVVQGYENTVCETESTTLRGVDHSEDKGFRHSTYKLNAGDCTD